MAITYRIHPAIGIARVGDSPDEYFIGPEAPGASPSLKRPDDATAQPGTYKDAHHRIKRQGARFRIYEYTADADGAVTHVREITAADATIDWDVHLVNRKAAAPRVVGKGHRNEGIPEKDLIVDSGTQRISGVNHAMRTLGGTFMTSIDVKLGDLLTDSAGRLIVLGGHGVSRSHDDSPLSEDEGAFADNNGWCDDVSDGSVVASITVNGSHEAVAADSAWVIVAPPDFAPALENVVTLYDVASSVMARLNPAFAITDSTRVSFTRDIYPILRRVSNLQWVSATAASHHGDGQFDHFTSRVSDLASHTATSEKGRKRIFDALRNPHGGGGDMPKLPDGTVRGAALTEVQYAQMERWAKGQFDSDWTGAEPTPAPFDALPERDRPHALDRAALEACVGGPFFPGIEASQMMLQSGTYDARRPFRINTKLKPGALTAGMAVPWQADFHDCGHETGSDWWPAQRPIQVRRGQASHASAWMPSDWTRNTMLTGWTQLGFVVEKRVAGKVRFLEDEGPLKSHVVGT